MKPSDLPAVLVEAPAEPVAKHQSSPNKEPLWGSVVKASATLVALIAAELSLIGHVTWATWLDHWGFDHGVLPIDATGRVIQGYVALMDRGGTLLSSWAGAFMATVFVVTGIYVSFILTAKSIAKRRGLALAKLPQVFQRAPWWLKDILLAFSISGIGIAAIYFLLVAAFLVLILGPVIGKGAANAWAARTEVQILKGCQRVDGHGVCTQVIHDGKVLASGLILASSTAHVAIYDVASKRPMMLRLEGADLTGWAP